MLKKLLLLPFLLLFPVHVLAADERVEAGRLSVLVPDGMRLSWGNAFIGNVKVYSADYFKQEWDCNFAPYLAGTKFWTD